MAKYSCEYSNSLMYCEGGIPMDGQARIVTVTEDMQIPARSYKLGRAISFLKGFGQINFHVPFEDERFNAERYMSPDGLEFFNRLIERPEIVGLTFSRDVFLVVKDEGVDWETLEDFLFGLIRPIVGEEYKVLHALVNMTPTQGGIEIGEVVERLVYALNK